MFKKIKLEIKKKSEIVALGLLILITIISTTYYNQSKKKILSNYKSAIENVYLKKTITHFFDNLEPKFKKIEHRVSAGETFDSILKEYSISDLEISEIKKKISKKFDLNKLNTKQKIKFVVNQSENIIKEFIFQISNTEKIYLTRNLKTDEFNQKIMVTKLKKKILYKENVILQSLYKSAIEKRIPANVIVDFAGIYGFQVDFQRDIRKKIAFKFCMKFLQMITESC